MGKPRTAEELDAFYAGMSEDEAFAELAMSHGMSTEEFTRRWNAASGEPDRRTVYDENERALRRFIYGPETMWKRSL